MHALPFAHRELPGSSLPAPAQQPAEETGSAVGSGPDMEPAAPSRGSTTGGRVQKRANGLGSLVLLSPCLSSLTCKMARLEAGIIGMSLAPGLASPSLDVALNISSATTGHRI